MKKFFISGFLSFLIMNISGCAVIDVLEDVFAGIGEAFSDDSDGYYYYVQETQQQPKEKSRSLTNYYLEKFEKGSGPIHSVVFFHITASVNAMLNEEVKEFYPDRDLTTMPTSNLSAEAHTYWAEREIAAINKTIEGIFTSKDTGYIQSCHFYFEYNMECLNIPSEYSPLKAYIELSNKMKALYRDEWVDGVYNVERNGQMALMVKKDYKSYYDRLLNNKRILPYINVGYYLD